MLGKLVILLERLAGSALRSPTPTLASGIYFLFVS